jgi:hypothetical protein
MAATDSCVAPCMPEMCDGDLVGRLRGLAGQRFDLGGDHRKAAAGSPARAASMVAFSASRLVCSAIAVISLTTSPISCAARDSLPMRPSVCSA